MSDPSAYLALDFGGTHVAYAAVCGSKVILHDVLPAEESTSMSAVLKLLTPRLQAIIKSHRQLFAGIGVGFCGLVDFRRQRITSTNRKYPDAVSCDLHTWSREHLQLPLLLENDVRLALLGELFAGAAQGIRDAALLSFGTGIGTAALIDGQLLRGAHCQAGVLSGHLKIPGSSRPCSCGGTGCYEAEASGFALASLCAGWPGFADSPLRREPQLNFAILFAHADRGEPLASAIRHFCLQVWRAVAVSLVHAYDPECLVLAGGVLKSTYPVLEAIRDEVHTNAWTPWGKVRVVRNQLGSEAALLGVTPLFQESA